MEGTTTTSTLTPTTTTTDATGKCARTVIIFSFTGEPWGYGGLGRRVRAVDVRRGRVYTKGVAALPSPPARTAACVARAPRDQGVTFPGRIGGLGESEEREECGKRESRKRLRRGEWRQTRKKRHRTTRPAIDSARSDEGVDGGARGQKRQRPSPFGGPTTGDGDRARQVRESTAPRFLCKAFLVPLELRWLQRQNQKPGKTDHLLQPYANADYTATTRADALKKRSR